MDLSTILVGISNVLKDAAVLTKLIHDAIDAKTADADSGLEKKRLSKG